MRVLATDPKIGLPLGNQVRLARGMTDQPSRRIAALGLVRGDQDDDPGAALHGLSIGTMVAMGTPLQKSPGNAPGTRSKRTVKTSTAYQLKVELLDVKPAVWRRILVPSAIKLSKLHSVLLRAMGWQGGHLHEFIFADASYGIPDDEWDLPPSGPAPESRVTLLKALGGLRTFTYVYDYGDNWEHKVRLERVVDNGVPITTPICLAGENACWLAHRPSWSMQNDSRT